MKHKVFLMGMLAMVLTFGMALIGCDNGSTSGGGGGDDSIPPRLVITNITGVAYSALQNRIWTGIYPVGTALSAIADVDNAVAIADDTCITLSGSSAPFTISATLYAVPDYENIWTGSGTYDVYFGFGGADYRKQNVSFTAAITTIDANDFLSVTIP
ncbi:hypothetical protein ACYULU_01320 [Breznakiellaceae bacterium SP9]